jgi:hypothetical protein
VEYQVRAKRSTGNSDWTIHIVEFGSRFNPPDFQVLTSRPAA